jgi:TetR/AcrR family transcriptional repressor of nem operon
MARPREFDRDRVVRLAIGVFREKGYEGTSTDDLLQAMGIGRQSMYDTFGDKRGLYLEALRRYNAESIGEIMHSYAGTASPLTGLENVLLQFAAQVCSEKRVNCMGVSAICEFGAGDAEVALITGSSSMTMASFLERVLQDAKRRDEISEATDEQGAARFIASTLMGMKICARAGASEETLRDIVGFAMKSLRAV